MSVWHDLLHINGELAHWLFEAEGLLLTVAWHWLWQRRHDLKHHDDGGCGPRCSEGHTFEGRCTERIEHRPRPWTKDTLAEQVEADVAEWNSIVAAVARTPRHQRGPWLTHTPSKPVRRCGICGGPLNPDGTHRYEL